MQESKYKWINAKSLFEEYKREIQNLDITDEGLRLERRELHKPGKELFNSPNLELKDVDADECDTLYILDRKSMSILTYNKQLENLQNPSYTSGTLAILFENFEGIAVDENLIYIIGTCATQDNEKPEGLIALDKKDLFVIWSILKGPEGFPLKGLTDLCKNSAGDLFVLEKGRHRLLKLSLSRREITFSEMGRRELERPEVIYSDAEGILHIFDEQRGYFTIGKDGVLEKKKMEGPAQELIKRRRVHDSRKNMYLISEDGKRLKFLKHIVENNSDSEGIFKGTYYSKCIDSWAHKNRWYRFVLEGKIQSGTTVEFSYHISDELLDEKKLKELPENKWEEGIFGSSVIQGNRKRDALFQTESEGRYLWFKLTLVGTEELSPVISSIAIFFPKVSYLEYLPSVYREDCVHREFLDRFLAIFESLFFEIDCKIDHLSRWFDAAGTPPEFLEWLGSWVGAPQGKGDISSKKNQVAKQREFISRAVSMYKDRGTRRGLENLIFLYTGKKPIIIENIPVYCVKGKIRDENLNISQNKRQEEPKESLNPKKNEDSEQKKYLFFPHEETIVECHGRKGAGERKIPLHEVLFGKGNFTFYVFFEEKLDESELELIRDIIEEEKPTYTTYKIKTLEPWFYLDGHTYLGLNTKLRRPEFRLEKSSVLGRDTVLGAANRFSFSGECREKEIMLIQSDQIISGKDHDYFNRRSEHGRK